MLHYLDKSIGHPNFTNCSKVYIIIGAKIFICYSLTCCKMHVFFTRCLFYFFCKQYNKRDQLILIFTLKIWLNWNWTWPIVGLFKSGVTKTSIYKTLGFLGTTVIRTIQNFLERKNQPRSGCPKLLNFEHKQILNWVVKRISWTTK